jgi:hypothetical protein
MIFDQFDYACSAESYQWLGVRRRFSKLNSQ